MLVVVYPRKRARLAAASRGWCGRVPFGCAGSDFAFLTRGARVKSAKTGFFHVENMRETITDLSFCLADVCIGDDSNDDAVTEWLNFG